MHGWALKREVEIKYFVRFVYGSQQLTGRETRLQGNYGLVLMRTLFLAASASRLYYQHEKKRCEQLVVNLFIV